MMLNRNPGALSMAALLMALTGCAAPSPSANTATAQPANQAANQAAKQPALNESVAIGDLPKAVVDAVQQELPGAVIAKARMQSDGKYHLSDVKVGKKEYTLTVSPDGKIINKEDDDD